ncbi:MAG: hypothetical protein WC569_00230 [Candidatus Omnitrophota bacterium]
MMRMIKEDRGVALILVISVLAVAGIMAVAFAFTMRLELKAAVNYLEAVRASQLAETGITHAQVILEEDERDIDSFEDNWRAVFVGDEVDNDSDGEADSKWINVRDDGGDTIGRYAVLVKDEAGLLNINIADKQNLSPLKVTEGWAPFELDLKKFFDSFKLDNSEDIYEDVADFRYGPDGQPGAAGVDDNQNQRILDYDGIDNNADGVIDESGEGVDEPLEFSPKSPAGDDRAFETPFEISKIRSIPRETVRDLCAYLTTYSTDRNVDVEGRLRNNINFMDANSLLVSLEDAGVRDPFQKAVNMIDACDEDFSQSVVTKLYNRLSAINKGPIGDWIWRGGRYESDIREGQDLILTWLNVPEGEYYVGVFGVKDELVGDITINNMTQGSVAHGEILRMGAVSFADRILNLMITNNSDKTCYFSYLELYPRLGQQGFSSVEIRGCEGIRINEIMVKPVIAREAFSGQEPGGDWAWQNGFYRNDKPNGGKQGEGTWTWKDIPAGKYYVRFFGGASGRDIGDAEINGSYSKNLKDGDLFGGGKVLTVSGGKLTVSVQNNLPAGETYFKSVELSQEPDGEYVELINLTPREVNLSGWSLEGPGKEGWPATIPLGTTIGPHEHLALAVDKDDSQSGISGNGLSFVSIWGRQRSAALHFLRTITPQSDLLSNTDAVGGNIIILKDPMGHVVDKEEYFSGRVTNSKSLEKSDPSHVIDSNNNGAPDNWHVSAADKGGTPGLPNNNEGMKERIGEEIIEHYDTEVNVKNRNFSSVGEAGFVPIGLDDWSTITTEDVAKIADRLTVFGIRLEAEGHMVPESESGWKIVQRAAPLTDHFESGSPDSIGTWKWEAEDGYYKLRIFGQEEEEISVSARLADGTWSQWTPALSPGPDNGIVFGDVEIGTGILELKIKNRSKTGAAHFDFIRLDPVNTFDGRVNVNTASNRILAVLPGIDDATANSIVNNRVFGNKGGLKLGIGDLLYADTLGSSDADKKNRFKRISNLVTVHSNLYRIIVTAQVLENGKVLAEKKIWAVFER